MFTLIPTRRQVGLVRRPTMLALAGVGLLAVASVLSVS